MLKNIIFINLTFLFLISCSDSSDTNSVTNGKVTNNNSTKSESAEKAAQENLSSKENANSISAANTNAVQSSEENLPKRISFSKGANWGSENVTLAPNSAKLFIVSAKAGQTMEVESASKSVAINLRKGKAETTEDFGFLNAELLADGDYVFEIRNVSKKEIKTSVKVTINSQNHEKGVLNDVDEENNNN